MAKGKRSGRRAEDVIASHAMKHHDFIGEVKEPLDAASAIPRLLEALRLKAEERLSAMPRPFKLAVHRTQQVAALLLAPARIGVALAGEAIRAPLQILGSLRRHEA